MKEYKFKKGNNVISSLPLPEFDTNAPPASQMVVPQMTQEEQHRARGRTSRYKNTVIYFKKSFKNAQNH